MRRIHLFILAALPALVPATARAITIVSNLSAPSNASPPIPLDWPSGYATSFTTGPEGKRGTLLLS